MTKNQDISDQKKDNVTLESVKSGNNVYEIMNIWRDHEYMDVKSFAKGKANCDVEIMNEALSENSSVLSKYFVQQQKRSYFEEKINS